MWYTLEDSIAAKQAWSDVKKLLISARELISDENRWVKKAEAVKRDKEGFHYKTKPTDPDACKWCASGALTKSFDDLELQENRIRLLSQSALSSVIGGGSIVGFDDNRGTDHKDVLAMFDRAIGRVWHQLKWIDNTIEELKK